MAKQSEMSVFLNQLYCVLSVLIYVLVGLSYKYQTAYTLYPATILYTFRQGFRMIDFEQTKSFMNHNDWDILRFQQITLCTFLNLIIAVIFSNIRGSTTLSIILFIMNYGFYLASLRPQIQEWTSWLQFFQDSSFLLILVCLSFIFIGYNMQMFKRKITE